jgi:hypothetical protein
MKIAYNEHCHQQETYNLTFIEEMEEFHQWLNTLYDDLDHAQQERMSYKALQDITKLILPIRDDCST